MDSLLQWLQLDQFVPGDLLVVAVLIVLEGLLSCDNAVVLALLVKGLPPALRGKALRYGIIGAYVFRIIALCLAAWVMSKWYLKVAGGAYLLWLAIRHFTKGEAAAEIEGQEVRRIRWLSPFWSTVVAVELTDIVFSVDSIAAAVALSDKLWVLILGGLLGILAMRFAAQGFVKLLEVFPRLEGAAFVAVGFIGLKLLLEFPVDVVGRTKPFAEPGGYATAQEYEQRVEAEVPPVLAFAHVITVNSHAAPPPDAEAMRQAALARLPADATPAQRAKVEADTAVEARRAHSSWNLHHRPFFEAEGWASSIVVLLIFSCGFLKRRKADEAG